MRSHRVFKVIITLVALGLCSFGIIATIQVFRTRSVAGKFLSDATRLQLRVAGMTEVVQLASRYPNHIRTKLCDSEGCAYTFDFDNDWLRRFRLAPATRLTCTLGVSSGVLVHRRLVMTSGNSPGPFGIFVEEWISYPKGLERLDRPFDMRRQAGGQSADTKWRVHVFLTADANIDQHRTAYGVNVGCLSKIGGCEDARQLLPTVDWNTMSQLSVNQTMP